MKNIIKFVLLIWVVLQSTYTYAYTIYPPTQNKNCLSNILLEDNHNVLWQEDILYEEAGIKVNKIYPNPASEFAYIDYQINESIKAKITVRNLLGRVVAEYDLSKQENQIKMNVSDFESGVYFYTLSVDGKSIKAKKLIVEHK
ncbi:MAG: T9SS C-terminal target domain-containing protein [Bacteroidetes bacterium]|nr:MAG: T9SS C-terminal target domain-containing protein [Bacteroidota bacterium]TAG85822.1 MAG: T9SS C-terminal target domain-containing protein [Bacteroidota bacterium]